MARFVQLLAQAHAPVGHRNLVRVQQRPHHQVAREQRRQQDARHHAGDEQLGDRHVGRDAVDDHDDGRRDEQAQRAGPGQRADGDVARVAAAAQLGQGHLADGGAGGRRRARYRGKDGAADHVGVQKAPRQPGDPGRQAAEHALAQLGAKQDLAHPDEQRQGGERPAGGRAPDGDGHGVARRAGREQLHADPGDAGQRQADPHAAAEQREQRQDQQAGDGEVTHCAAPPRRRRRARAGHAAPAPIRPRRRRTAAPCPRPWRSAGSTAAWRRCRWTCR